jgi:hypothetical protein
LQGKSIPAIPLTDTINCELQRTSSQSASEDTDIRLLEFRGSACA